YVASEASAGKYNPTSGIWTIPVLQSKESQTLKVTAKVKEKGDYLNIVYLTDSNPVDNNETNNRAEASIKVKDVIVYNSVSPNGDDLNDYLRIDGLDQYPNNSVEIFNPGGVQIFKTSNYGSNGNVFRGISEGRVTIDKQRGVPTG
ncbi:T9SS type B sorting domain-containing protein, partial [Flavobacterium collinsii]|uniref:T9SS type B sorting domain-containing protein n=1 Tax=Flavobacterium collinsii TaxID=1114861 RepID=UPI00156F0162